MDWPKSAGKGVEAHIADGRSRLDRVRFESDIRSHIGLALASKLRPTHFQVLFEISDDYVRRCTAVSDMKNKNSFLKDCSSRTDLMAKTRKWLVDFQRGLNPQIPSNNKPATALLARSISKKLSELQIVLEQEFAAVELHGRLSKSMLQTLSLKYMRTSYVAHLNSYIEDVALRNLPDQKKASSIENLIVGVMSAAGVFSAPEKAAGLEETVHTARWRAKGFIKNEFYGKGDFPVFQTQPRGKTRL